MAQVPGPVKRAYSSPARAAAAARTRTRIRMAAADLFVSRGYGSTSVRDIAAQAGVTERTVFSLFATKAELFAHVLGVAIVGDEKPIPVADRPEVTSALEERGGAKALAQMVDYNVALLERAGDLIWVMIESIGSDDDMRRMGDEGAEANAANLLRFAQSMHTHAALREELGPAQAADIMFVMTSPHVHHMLRRMRRWSRQRFENWLLASLTQQLLR